MNEFSYQQKIAAMRILLDIIHADGIIDARELFYFERLKKEFNLSDGDHEVVKDKNSLVALSQLKKFDEQQKKYFAKLMVSMIVVDEDINVNELELYNIVCEFCSINTNFADVMNEEGFNNSEITYS
jgi:uncharacterized tellurite resistance protein B-like protein